MLGLLEKIKKAHYGSLHNPEETLNAIEGCLQKLEALQPNNSNASEIVGADPPFTSLQKSPDILAKPVEESVSRTEQVSDVEKKFVPLPQSQGDGPGKNEFSAKLDRLELLRVLETYFDLNEQKTVCFDMQVKYEDLPGGEQLSAKARELIAYLERVGRLGELEPILRRLRPHVFRS